MATKRVKANKQQASLFASTTSVPQMPEGYYSGDQPNPHLRAFVEAHLAAHPYDPANDDYDVPAFDQPIETTKATAIYNMHTYWSKKPHDAIRQYIAHYTQPGDLVLDPFCGSGGTALAALMEGRAAIAIDRSPAATFITKNYCTPVDVDALQAAFEELQARVKPELDWLYATRCDRCDGPAITGYTVYSQVFQCPRCLSKVPLFDCGRDTVANKAGQPKVIRTCPFCKENDIIEAIDPTGKRLGSVPVAVSYLCANGCKPARSKRLHNDPDSKKRHYFERYDLARITEIEKQTIPHWYPTDRMMHAPENQARWGLLWRPYLSDVTMVSDLYTKRNLWALSAIRHAITVLDVEQAIRDMLLFAFESIVLINSRMCEAQNTQITKGTYYMPQVFKELYPLSSIEGKIEVIEEAQTERDVTSTDLLISTQSACDFPAIPPASVDYVFTDPPYANKVQYGELNFVWEAWLNADTGWHDEEIIINEVRGRSEANWAAMMRQAMAECYRVLKPGHWLSLCYHDSSEGTWELIQDLMAEAGFVVDAGSGEALFIDAGQKSWKQLVADKVTKRDLVINFRKPRPDETQGADVLITGEEDARTFGEKARAIIRDYLTAYPGSTKDRIYDALVSHMVRAGSMEAHDFDALLAQVAEETRQTEELYPSETLYPGPDVFPGPREVSRWYLKEAVEAEAVDEAESAREDAAAGNLSAFMRNWLRDHPAREGVHYSDLFERYVYAVREKPRRALQDWLPDYFYKTDDGGWRPPVGEEEVAAKAQARADGASRRIRRYLSFVRHDLAIPERERPSDATLAAWIRHCRRAGLYEQGKLLYESGGLRLERLSEEAQVEVEEDYQVCVRRIARKADDAANGKRGGAAKGGTAKRRAPASEQMRLELE